VAAKSDKKSDKKVSKKVDAKADKKVATKGDKKALRKELEKALEKAKLKAARAKAEAKIRAKKAEKRKAQSKLELKTQKKADRAAEQRFLDESIAADTHLAAKADADAKKALAKERSLVASRLQKAKRVAEKLEVKRATDATDSRGVASLPVPQRAPAAGPRAPRTSRTGTSAVRSSAQPSESWTMVALRSYAGATGVTGYSRLNKADLLAKLRGTDSAE
jgi:hypothetical protein